MSRVNDRRDAFDRHGRAPSLPHDAATALTPRDRTPLRRVQVGMDAQHGQDRITAGEPVSGRGPATAHRRHWFYDNRFLVGAFCLFSFVAIFWQVSRFEGFQPIFRCESARDIDRWLLTSGMDACMDKANSANTQARCMRTVYVLACTKERWR